MVLSPGSVFRDLIHSPKIKFTAPRDRPKNWSSLASDTNNSLQFRLYLDDSKPGSRNLSILDKIRGWRPSWSFLNCFSEKQIIQESPSTEGLVPSRLLSHEEKVGNQEEDHPPYVANPQQSSHPLTSPPPQEAEMLRIEKAVTKEEMVNALRFIGRERNHSTSKMEEKVTKFMGRIEQDQDVTIFNAYRQDDKIKTPVAAVTAFHLPDNGGTYIANFTTSSNRHRSEPASSGFLYAMAVSEQCPKPTLFHSFEKISPEMLKMYGVERFNSSKDLPPDLLSKLEETVKLPNKPELYLYIKKVANEDPST